MLFQVVFSTDRYQSILLQLKRGKVTPGEIVRTLATWKPATQSAFWLISSDLNIRRRHKNFPHSSQNGIWYDCCALERKSLIKYASNGCCGGSIPIKAEIGLIDRTTEHQTVPPERRAGSSWR